MEELPPPFEHAIVVAAAVGRDLCPRVYPTLVDTRFKLNRKEIKGKAYLTFAAPKLNQFGDHL